MSLSSLLGIVLPSCKNHFSAQSVKIQVVQEQAEFWKLIQIVNPKKHNCNFNQDFFYIFSLQN